MGSEEITRNEEICEEEKIFKHEVNNKINNNDSDFNEILEEIQQNASVNNFENITNSFDNSKLLIDEWKKRKETSQRLVNIAKSQIKLRENKTKKSLGEAILKERKMETRNEASLRIRKDIWGKKK